MEAGGLFFNVAGKKARQVLIDEKLWVFENDREATVADPVVEIVDAPALLHVGGTYTFKARVEPSEVSQEVKWSVNEGDEWGTFSGNVLTVKKTGRIFVTATSVAVPTSRRSVEVQVLDPISLTGIAVSPSAVELNVNGTQQLTVGYTPADATNRRVTWHSSDKGVATVDAQGLVTGVKGGTATITATSVDGGHRGTCTVTVVADDKPSGVESALLAGVTVSPNPFDARLIVRGAEGVLRYSLVSVTGAEVLRGAHDGASELRLETGRLAAGVYWLRLEAADGERAVQVVRR